MRPKGIVILIGLCVPLSLAFEQRTSDSFVVRDVRLFDGQRVFEHRSVLVEDGKIKRVAGPNWKARSKDIIDGRGRTLLPGLIDSHVHVVDDSSLRQAVSLGVTTVLDMFSGGSRLDRLKQIQLDDAPGLADVRTAGIGATAPGGHPTQMGGPPIPTITDPDQAQSFIDARLAEGSDYIKTGTSTVGTFYSA